MRPWEQRDNPDLRGKRPNGVRRRRLTNRKFGVRSAMSSITAKRQRPDLVSRRQSLRRRVSRSKRRSTNCHHCPRLS